MKAATKRITRFFFSTTPAVKNFPYVFGGIIASNQKINSFGSSIVKTLFGQDLGQGLEMAYRGVLEAIADKDIEYLNSNLEQNLTKTISIPDCRVVNQNSHIDVALTRYKIIFGAPFSRDNKLYAIDIKQGLSRMNIPIPSSFINMISIQAYGMNYPSGMVPILIQLGVDFSSPYKLIQNQKNNNSSAETHHLQFEAIMQVDKEGVEMPNSNNPNFLSAVKHLQEKLMTPDHQLKKYTWKISDIDNTLQGNPWPIY